MGTKKNENVEEFTILSKEQIDALPNEAVEKVRSLSGGDLPAKQMQIFVPVVQLYMALRDKALELKLERDEDGEITKESIEAYKSLKADQRSFNGDLKREINKVKGPLNAIKADVITVEKTFAEESEKIKIAAQEEFADYEAEVEKKKQEALDRKNAAMNEQIDKAKEEAERLQKQSEVSNLYNKIKYTLIQEGITNAVDDAIFNNNEDALAALKAQIAQKTFESICPPNIGLLDEDSLVELDQSFLKAKERAIHKLDQKFEEYERKRQEYAEQKAIEQVPHPPSRNEDAAPSIPDAPMGLNTDDIQRTNDGEVMSGVSQLNQQEFNNFILKEIQILKNTILERLKTSGNDPELLSIYNKLNNQFSNI